MFLVGPHSLKVKKALFLAESSEPSFKLLGMHPRRNNQLPVLLGPLSPDGLEFHAVKKS